MLKGIKLFIYDLLAGRCDITFRSLSVSSTLSIVRPKKIIIYCSSTKLGDSIYIKHLVKSIKIDSDIEIIILTKENIIEIYSDLEDVYLFSLKDRYGIFSIVASHIRFRRLKLITLNTLFINFDSEDFIEVPLFLRINKLTNTLGFGKERYRVFKYSFSNYFYCIDKYSFHQKINRVLDFLNIKYLTINQYVRRKSNKIFLNQSGADHYRRFTKEQVSSILLLIHAILPDASVVVSSFDSSDISLKIENFSVLQNVSLLELEKTVKDCDICITPDTSIAHISALSGLKTLIFFADNYYNNYTWMPCTSNVYTFVPNKSQPLSNLSLNEITDCITEFLIA